MLETLVLMQLAILLETCLRQIKIAIHSVRYVDAKIPEDMMFQRTLDSEWELCSKSVGFRTYILFDICWIPRTHVLHLFDSAQKLLYICWILRRNSDISVGLRTEILLDLFCISHRISVRYLLESMKKFCSICVGFCAEVLFHIAGFRTDILFDICWIPCTNSLRYLLDSAPKFCLIYVGLHTEILHDACCISHKFCCISAGFRTELVFRKTSNVCRPSQCLLSVTRTEDLAVVQLGSRSTLQAICTCILAAGGSSSLWT
jgi:hypothetical protein